MMKKINLNKKNLLPLAIATLLLVCLLGEIIYVYFWKAPLIIPNQYSLKNNPITIEAVSILASRWNVQKDKIVVLSLWKNPLQDGVTLLNSENMSGARFFTPIAGEIPENRITNGGYLESFVTNSGNLFLESEFRPETINEITIIQNYYSGKYPWLGAIKYDVLIMPIPRKGWLNIGNASYPMFFGLPLNSWVVVD